MIIAPDSEFAANPSCTESFQIFDLMHDTSPRLKSAIPQVGSLDLGASTACD
jgi:hypothetical protein